MINRVDRKKIDTLPKAVRSDGVCCCPLCWHTVCEPISGNGKVAIWCRWCKRNVLVELKDK